MDFWYLSLTFATKDNLPYQAGFYIGKATYSSCLSGKDKGDRGPPHGSRVT